MRTATVREAKEHLEELIEAAMAGEQVEITADGRSIAALVPPKVHGHTRTPAPTAVTTDWEAKMDDLERRGIITRSKISAEERAEIVKRILEPLPGAGRPSGVLEALLEERRTGR